VEINSHFHSSILPVNTVHIGMANIEEKQQIIMDNSSLRDLTSF
jgi:hypothetical protein